MHIHSELPVYAEKRARSRHSVASLLMRAARIPRGALLAAALLAGVSPLALADPPLGADQHCQAATPEEARRLADVLFDEGAYQRAGDCYEAAGEYARANRAFLKAAGPQSAVTVRQASAQGDQAKALLHRVQQALGAGH